MNSKRAGQRSDSVAERNEWVARYRASGLGLKRFAAEHGLRPGQLHYWVYQRRATRPPIGPAAPVFQELSVPSVAAARSPWRAEIGLPDGTTVRLDGHADVSWVSALLASLRAPCSR